MSINDTTKAETQWLYDEPTGLLTNKVYDDGNGSTYSYYPNGQLHTRTWAREVVTSNSYNIAGQLVSTTYSDGTPTITREYNRLGQPIIVTDAQGTRTFTYDTNTFALLSESINGTNMISYSYDFRGRRTGETCLALNSSYTFDEFGRQSSIAAFSNGETNTFHFNYLYGSAMVSSITNNLGFGVSKYYEDNRNLITCVSNYFGSSPISAFIYQNDALGRRSQRIDANYANSIAITNSFSYNQHQELEEADMGTDNYNFTHDDIGNRTYCEFPIQEEYYESNALNAYTKVWTYTPWYARAKFYYDLDGNMITNQLWAYTWNAENRMSSATNTADSTYVTYKYDYQGRMFEKVTNGVTNNFVWNGNHIVAEFTDSSTNYFTWANGETLCANLDGETVFYCHDANKNVTDLVDDSGDIVAHYEYSPFGVITDQREELANANPFRFSNEYWDETTGLVEYKYRIYLPPLGKFLSLDPIGEQGGLNLYGIGGNDLINKFDLWGNNPYNQGKYIDKEWYPHSQSATATIADMLLFSIAFDQGSLMQFKSVPAAKLHSHYLLGLGAPYKLDFGEVIEDEHRLKKSIFNDLKDAVRFADSMEHDGFIKSSELVLNKNYYDEWRPKWYYALHNIWWSGDGKISVRGQCMFLTLKYHLWDPYNFNYTEARVGLLKDKHYRRLHDVNLADEFLVTGKTAEIKLMWKKGYPEQGIPKRLNFQTGKGLFYEL